MILSESPKIQALNMDCMEFMKDKPDNYYDLAIVDPPYGIGIMSQFKSAGYLETKSMFKQSKGIKHSEWDAAIPDGDYFTELSRVSTNRIIWGGNYFLDYLGATRCLISWDKMNGTNNMSDFEIAWTNFDSGCRRFSMHHFSAGYGEKIHICQKPIKLYRWLLDNYASCKYCKNAGMYFEDVAGDGGSQVPMHCEECCRGERNFRILDTHGGSMSSAIACHMEGFDLDICELDEDYFNDAVKRFKLNTIQERLF